MQKWIQICLFALGMALLPACTTQAPLNEYQTTESMLETDTEQEEIPGMEEIEEEETSNGRFTISFNRLKVVLDWF